MLVEIAIGSMRFPGGFAGDVVKVGPLPLRLVDIVPFLVELGEIAEMQAEEPGTLVVDDYDAVDRARSASGTTALPQAGPSAFHGGWWSGGESRPTSGGQRKWPAQSLWMPSFEKLPHAVEFLSNRFASAASKVGGSDRASSASHARCSGIRGWREAFRF
jgi:hypothetical protein